MLGRWKGIGPMVALGKRGLFGAVGPRDRALCRAGARGSPGRMQDEERSRDRPARAASRRELHTMARRCAAKRICPRHLTGKDR